MKASLIAAVLMASMLDGSQAVVLEKAHKHKAKAKDEDPPPEVPGGLADSRYTSSWRKAWPQGHDNGDDDANVLDRFNKPDPKKKKEVKEEKYPWTYDKDVIDTGKSIEKGEEMKGDKLSYDAVATFKGRDMVFQFTDGNHKTNKAPVKGVQGWDYNTEYNGEWQKKTRVDNWH